MTLKFCKVRSVKSPVRANPGDAGIDFFFPEGTPAVDLTHGESVLIPSGIKVDVPFGYAMIFFNKSGVASNKRLDVLACVVDHGYKGECHLNLINNGHSKVRLSPGDKVVQGILLPVALFDVVETDPTQMWLEAVGSRGEGGFGSTGTS